ncbi:MAG TPA: NADP-dependent oxidoreductase [Mycobacteriales bacterium]|jgi:NADPH-dependent curcumin reductase CurA|nr:NADP-dependent oxidoreductase [Mycobacteriales bacterium]
MSTPTPTPHPTADTAAYPREARAVVLAKRGSAATPPTFEITAVPVRPPRQGEVVVRNLLTSVDPYMGFRMRGDVSSYAEAYPEGRPVAAGSVGVVVASEHPDIKVGGWLLNESGWREFATVPGDVHQVADPDAADDVAWLSVLGMTGITAWVALHEVCNVEAGQTVAVTAAAGAVGGVAVQLAKAAGARVIGIAGGEVKRQHVQSALGADVAIDYTAAELAGQLREATDGIDVVVDNVGGPQLGAMLHLLNDHARVALVGRLGATGDDAAVDISVAVPRRVRLEGLIVIDYLPRWPAIRRALASLLADGQLRPVVTVSDGLDGAPEALAGLFHQGAPHLGKRLVRIAS